MTDEYTGPAQEPNDLLRRQDFDTESPIELDITNSFGRIDIELAETDLTQVEIGHDPEAGSFDWREGFAGLLNWVSERFSEAGVTSGASSGEHRAKDPTAEAVRQTVIDFTGSRLVVRPPKSAQLRSVPLSIKVRAPQESHIELRSESAPVNITGPACRVKIHSGSGVVSLDQSSGKSTVLSRSAALRLGAMSAGVDARSGSGDIEIVSIGAASSLGSSTGNIWLGELGGDVLLRTGSGDVTVADAAVGDAELITGSGALRVSVRQGVAAEVDLTSSTGTASSDLPVADEPPAEQPTLKIFGRTGNGNAVLTSSL